MRKICHIIMTLFLLLGSVISTAHTQVMAGTLPGNSVAVSDMHMDQMTNECGDCLPTDITHTSCDILCAVPVIVMRKDAPQNMRLIGLTPAYPVSDRVNGVTRSPELSPPRSYS